MTKIAIRDIETKSKEIEIQKIHQIINISVIILIIFIFSFTFHDTFLLSCIKI